MLEYIKQEANRTTTENGAETYASTGSDCLDLFATIGALRNAEDHEILHRFFRAYAEDPNSAMKILFFARDIKEGLGERRVFRTIVHQLAKQNPESILKNLDAIVAMGRYDDLYALIDTQCEDEMFKALKTQFELDMEHLTHKEPVSLLGKWLPSINASNKETVHKGRKTAAAFGLSEKAYRKACTALRAQIHILENNLRERNYTFDYEKQPSRALFKYRMAFLRNDKERYTSFMNRVETGEATLHTSNLSPYELVAPILDNCCLSGDEMNILSEEEKNVLNTTWASLTDYDCAENTLCVIDTSGSMYFTGNPMPASVAISLGLYFAEHTSGAFKNCFIEFSNTPQLIEIKGETFADRLQYVSSFSEIASTNLEAVFDLILDAAVKNHVPQSELPQRLVLISDMEFNICTRNASSTVFEQAKLRYEEHGYTLPSIVFWNVQSRNRQQPVTMNENNVTLVSGATPQLFQMMTGANLSPFTFMMDVLNKERYANIRA